MPKLALGLDLGSSSTKGILLDPEVGIVAEAARPTVLASPHPGWSESDPAQWWANVVSLAGELLRVAGASAGDVASVSTTGMVPAVVLVGRDGHALRPAILQNDARAVSEIGIVREELGNLDLLQLTGSMLTQQSVAPTLRWLSRHEPEVLAAASFVVGSYDWLALALGAEPHVELNWALESGLFVLDGLALLEEAVAAARIRPSLLPRCARPGNVVGELSKAAAEATGLLAGTPIVVGGADHVLSAWSAGLDRRGDFLIKLGSSGDILVVTDWPLVDERLYLDAHPLPNRWLPNGCMATSGSLLGWLRGLAPDLAPELVEAEVAEARPGEVLCLPYFLGEKSPLHDPDRRGAFLGLGLDHSWSNLYLAALEAIAYGFRRHVDVFTERGVELGTGRVTNGGSRSGVWKQVVADVLGLPLLPVPAHPGASLGAAALGSIGTGVAQDWSVLAPLLATGPPVEPRPSRRDLYEEGYKGFLRADEALLATSHELARFQRRER